MRLRISVSERVNHARRNTSDSLVTESCAQHARKRADHFVVACYVQVGRQV